MPRDVGPARRRRRHGHHRDDVGPGDLPRRAVPTPYDNLSVIGELENTDDIGHGRAAGRTALADHHTAYDDALPHRRLPGRRLAVTHITPDPDRLP
jgi:hypothetical protein